MNSISSLASANTTDVATSRNISLFILLINVISRFLFNNVFTKPISLLIYTLDKYYKKNKI